MTRQTKVMTIVGARPQFIKAAVLSRLFRSPNWAPYFSEFLVHTGQHYDNNMSDIFFQEMGIPVPDLQLRVGGQSHGAMTGQMLEQLERAMQSEKPDLVLIYGDTNTTLAGALAASKLLIPLAHVEAGLRSYNRTMPEEQNRVATDHLSDWLFCPTDSAVTNLRKEGIQDQASGSRVCQVGDIMFDAYLHYKDKAQTPAQGLKDLPTKFILLTLHRAENVDHVERLREIIGAFNSYTDVPCFFPVHPRTRTRIEALGMTLSPHIHLMPPVGYFEMIYLQSRCSIIATDSGGVQKEAYFAGKPCITLRGETEWTETVESGWNQLANTQQSIHESLQAMSTPTQQYPIFGNGDTGTQILQFLTQLK